ncbi:MAG: hypothetical protein V4739_08225 [Pseudomonadota bacterium]
MAHPLHRARLAVTAAVLGVAGALTGCVVAPTDGYYHATGAVVPVAPLPPVVEIYGPPPVTGHVWIGGHWDGHRDRHHWRPGHRHAPRHDHRWRSHTWRNEGGGWRPRGGRWER